MLILIGFKARHLVPIMLPIIPAIYLLGTSMIARVTTPSAQLGGGPYMMIYFIVCIVTFLAIIAVKIKKKNPP